MRYLEKLGGTWCASSTYFGFRTMLIAYYLFGVEILLSLFPVISHMG